MVCFFFISKFTYWPGKTLQAVRWRHSSEVIQHAIEEVNYSFWALKKNSRFQHLNTLKLCIRPVTIFEDIPHRDDQSQQASDTAQFKRYSSVQTILLDWNPDSSRFNDTSRVKRYSSVQTILLNSNDFVNIIISEGICARLYPASRGFSSCCPLCFVVSSRLSFTLNVSFIPKKNLCQETIPAPVERASSLPPWQKRQPRIDYETQRTKRWKTSASRVARLKCHLLFVAYLLLKFGSFSDVYIFRHR